MIVMTLILANQNSTSAKLLEDNALIAKVVPQTLRTKPKTIHQETSVSLKY